MCSPSVAEFTLNVGKAAFIRARSFKITRAVGLAVYRSVVLRETDDWHKPIEQALGMYPHREVHREVRQDPDMMFREAELLVYALGDTQEEADESADVILRWQEATHAVLAV